MEYLKTSSTNAQAIGDFDAVAFQAFSVTRSSNHISRTHSWTTSEDTRAAEAELRREQHLVVHDTSRPLLWLFRATTSDQVHQKPVDLPVVEGYHFKREQHGVMKAAELARPPIRSANQNQTPTSSTSSPKTSGPPKVLHGGGARQPQALDQPQQYDSFAIYERFTSSVVALISYRLVQDRKAIALNYRTFISKPAAQEENEAGEPGFLTGPYCLTNIDVFWASSGTLVVSTYSLTKPEIRCLNEVEAADQQTRLVGTCVRLAPNGTLAQVTSFDEPLDSFPDDVSQRSHRKRPKTGPYEQGIERWKSTVKRWLDWKGYAIPALDRRDAWVRVRIGHMGQHMVSSPELSGSSREMLWPRALCYFYDNGGTGKYSLTLEPTPGHGDGGLKWFETPISTGYEDPADAAQKWFLGKPERDKTVEARRRAKRQEEDAKRAKEENRGLFPSSPLNARTGAYGDLQAVSGVYPTPPDGLPPGTAVSSGDTPSVSGAGVNVILPPGGTNPAINLSAPQDIVHTDKQPGPPTSPEFNLSDDQYNIGGGNDDLFEDMEEDGYEGNGITDADFSFFDEPDEEDVDMPDVQEEAKPDLKKQPEKETPVTSAPEPAVKEEAADPMAALEDALVTASNQPEVTPELKAEEGGMEGPASEPKPLEALATRSADVERQETAPATREPTPPLSPGFIEQALLPSPKGKALPQSQGHPRDSVFDPLNFNRKMSITDAKYHEGRFSFPAEKVKKQQEQTRIALHQPKSLRDMPLLTKLRYAIGVASTKPITEVPTPATDDGDLSDTSSETSSESDEPEEGLSGGTTPLPTGLIIPIKRKLPTEGHATPLSATSFAGSFGGDLLDIPRLYTDESILGSLEPTIWDWALVNAPPPAELSLRATRYTIPAFSPLLPSLPNTPISPPDITMDMLDEKALNGKDSIAVAQIVTDQIVSATLDLLHESSAPIMEKSITRAPSETPWQSTIRDIFPTATECNVTALASIHDVFPDLPPQSKGQQRPPPRKPNEGPATLGHHMHQISPPYLRVRRAELLWDLLPPALPFWEPLGLSPCSPAKNVVAFCIYPHSESLRLCTEDFMTNLQLAYNNCRLGSHARVKGVSEYEAGLVPYKIATWSSRRAAFKALRDTCGQLGKFLAAKHAQLREKEDEKIDAFVIYMIDPFEDPTAIWELCSAFWSLFQSYGQGPPGRVDQIQKPDLVLQIVPIKHVASFEAPVILDVSTYSNLAREVYDRCPPSAPSEDKTPLSIYTAPSFQLEEPIPRAIPFKLNAEPPQDLLHENSYIHLGYAISLDGTWVTAAWTDICGKAQAVVSYSLGTRLFGEVAKEIWQTTIEILQARRVTWRVCISKAGVMDREEMEAWVFLVSCPTQLNLFITLLTVDPNPHLKFTPSLPSINSSSTSAGGQLAGATPGSTPQPGVSPEHGLTPAATPSQDTTADPTTDPDARLVDTTDETWGVILAHRLHNSNSTNEFRPALISGLLVKRGNTPTTPGPAPGPLITAVNILWMGAVNPTRAATSPFPTTPVAAAEGVSPGGVNIPPSPSPQERSYSSLTWTPTVQTRAAAENLLKEVLGQFRGLGLLAKLRGMRGTRSGVVPWHVAASVRGVEGLGRCVPK